MFAPSSFLGWTGETREEGEFEGQESGSYENVGEPRWCTYPTPSGRLSVKKHLGRTRDRCRSPPWLPLGLPHGLCCCTLWKRSWVFGEKEKGESKTGAEKETAASLRVRKKKETSAGRNHFCDRWRSHQKTDPYPPSGIALHRVLILLDPNSSRLK